MRKFILILVGLLSVSVTYGQFNFSFGNGNNSQNNGSGANHIDIGNTQTLKRVTRTQKLYGFSETITINGTKTYWVSDNNACFDYRIIAQKGYFVHKKTSIMTGELVETKMPAYGLIDGNNRVVVPCVYAEITIEPDKGCIVLHSCNKKYSDDKYGLVDFDGKEVLPIKYSEKNIWKGYDKLSSEFKNKCIELYNSKNKEYLAKAEKRGAAAQNGELYASEKTETARPAPKSDVDVNIPVTNNNASNTFVLIIANEDYEFIDDVQYALNDGETFREYCIKTLGVPERQVWMYKNASAGIISGGVDKMMQAMSIFDNAKAIVYYCGHGIPDEKTGDAYLVPTDGKGTNVATCYSLNKLYTTLASVKSSSVTYFMDACFTGANRDGSMLVAARGVAREAKKEIIKGNAVVFSAASGDETAMPFKEKEHGLFTYFLLKKLQETKGDVSYGELADYIRENVKKEAFLTNEKPQNPVIATSEASTATWRNMKM